VTAAGIIITIAGNGTYGYAGDGGPGSLAQLSLPTGLAVDRADNLYLTDRANHSIRKIDPDGTISTVAGSGVEGFSGHGGPATRAQLSDPTGSPSTARATSTSPTTGTTGFVRSMPMG
jgi:hypothetical protein